MLKRLFPFAFEDGIPPAPVNTRPIPRPAAVVAAPKPEPPREPPPPPVPAVELKPAAKKIMDFEEIYQTAQFKPPKLPYSILKVVEMASSPHLQGLSPEAKRSALLMALDAAAVQTEDLLQDAMLRQRALNEAEEALRKRLEDFEETKAKENSKIQSELEKLTTQYLARIQNNVDDVAREEDEFRDWQKRKQEESSKMAEVATLCLPAGSTQNTNNLTLVLERAAAQHR